MISESDEYRDLSQDTTRRAKRNPLPVERRNGRHHQYSTLDHGGLAYEDVGEYMEMEKRSRDRALSICQAYIRGTPRYTLIKQLNNVEFFEHDSQKYVILVQPISQGSLKDLIYGVSIGGCSWMARCPNVPVREPNRNCRSREIAGTKTGARSTDREERGFPMVTHLHSGNVLVQNGVARLAGLENTLLGFTSRIHPVVTSRLSQTHSIDMICFGHMLFEMCVGYELCSFKPTAMHLSDLETYPQVVELLDSIFVETCSHYPSVEDLLVHDLFRNIDLREMRSAPVTIFRPILTPSIVNLLEVIKRQNMGKRLTSLDTDDMISLESPEPVYEDSLLVQIYNELTNTAV